jgi:heme exporter protein A
VTAGSNFSIGLVVTGVAVDRGGKRICEGASFTLAPGEALMMRGPNGAGKTTLLRALAGLAPIAVGEARLTGAGEESSGESARRGAIVYCGHANSVKAALSGRQNLKFWSAMYSAPAERMDEAIAAFDLDAFVSALAGTLSAGQRRRLGLARLVISGKPLWLLDEPTAAIDVASASRLSAVIGAHRARGGAVIVATHDGLHLDDALTVHIKAVAA